MSIETPRDLLGIKRAGCVVSEALGSMTVALEAGMRTGDLDRVCQRVLDRHGATSAPRDEYGFPGACCVSVNDEAVHGEPGERVLRDGDVVKIDVEASLDGYVADAARTLVVGADTPLTHRLIRCARAAFDAGIRAAQSGNRTRDIGRAVERRVRRDGFSVIRPLYGHGVGAAAHEEPSVPSFDDPRCSARLAEGLVITVEPIIAAGNGTVREDGRWLIRTRDGSIAAHHEETIIITRGEPIIVTAA